MSYRFPDREPIRFAVFRQALPTVGSVAVVPWDVVRFYEVPGAPERTHVLLKDGTRLTVVATLAEVYRELTGEKRR